MQLTLKPLGQQVVVITGASSGIGLVTAREAARRGARVVLAARDADDLAAAAERIRADGGRAEYVVADVADFDALAAVAERAEAAFGGIDTWVNNAGVTIYGRVADVPLADARRLFETNYWGVVHGSLVAVPYLARRGGGALVNLGSVLSDTAMPLQGHYSASKHAVKGFTDALRIELEHDDVPVSVTLVKPASVDTPYAAHAGNQMGVAPRPQPPVYAPAVVARAILAAAETPHRDITVGGAAKLATAVEAVAPRIVDRAKRAVAFDTQQTARLPRGDTTLYAPRSGSGRERGDYPGHVMQWSALTAATLHPLAAAAAAAAVGLGVAFAARERA